MAWKILFFFVAGFFLLIKGVDLLVDGSTSLARHFRISEIVIGLTIVSFGTSVPELVVNLMASLHGNSELAVGNILGSNIANILLILGISSVIRPLTVHKNTVWKEIPLSLLAAIMVGILANDRLLGDGSRDLLSRGDGLVLLAFFIVFLYYTIGIARNGIGGKEKDADNSDGSGEGASRGIVRSLIYLGIGLVALPLGGEWIVDGAVRLTTRFGLSESLVGLTVVALGTSLPELAASSVAAWKGKSDIAVGNVVGSNIFNIFWILGASALIRPIPFMTKSNADIWMTVFASLLLFLFFFIGRRHTLQRSQGILFLFIYAGYIAFLVWRG